MILGVFLSEPPKESTRWPLTSLPCELLEAFDPATALDLIREAERSSARS